MRFPHYLFGFHMTTGLWYVLILVGAILIFWILQKIFRNVVKDFAGGMVIFVVIIIFVFTAISLLSGVDTISSGVGGFLDTIFP
ncbi:MAG: hypothetical protein ACYDH1_02465 [Anaerolineaceae bacterium]|jgi:hypothetical protein|nr:MAG: hypothetical protein CVU46_10970 [Chloroflexi bacterium HGW-Chloroflexi-8]